MNIKSQLLSERSGGLFSVTEQQAVKLSLDPGVPSMVATVLCH